MYCQKKNCSFWNVLLKNATKSQRCPPDLKTLQIHLILTTRDGLSMGFLPTRLIYNVNIDFDVYGANEANADVWGTQKERRGEDRVAWEGTKWRRVCEETRGEVGRYSRSWRVSSLPASPSLCGTERQADGQARLEADAGRLCVRARLPLPLRRPLLIVSPRLSSLVFCLCLFTAVTHI